MKKRIRLTESDLHRIVRESVNRILRESELDADFMSDFWRGLNVYEPFSVDRENLCKKADDDLRALWQELKNKGFEVSNITTYDDGTPTFKVKAKFSKDNIMRIINNGHHVMKHIDGNIIVVTSMSGDYMANYDENGFEAYTDDDDTEPPTMQNLLRRGDNVSTWGDDVGY